jgi:hypothetical protein
MIVFMPGKELLSNLNLCPKHGSKSFGIIQALRIRQSVKACQTFSGG